MSDTHTHPSRLPHKRRKPNRPHSTKLTTATTGTSTSTLKKKIRDLTRFLAKKTTLPADVRLENERALDAFKHELAAAQGAAREGRIAEKYRMVRFFERKKASRKLAQLVRRRRDTTEADEALEKMIHEAEVDVNYTMYFPRGEKYIALYKDAAGAPKVVERREAVRKGIERQMEAGTLGSAHGGMKDDDEDEEMEEEGMREKREKGRKRKAVEEPKVEVEEDDFFEF